MEAKRLANVTKHLATLVALAEELTGISGSSPMVSHGSAR
jgi:hypothetical protein